jgi:hypothetical protein
MPITYQPPGYGELVAGLAYEAGRAKARERAGEIALRQAEQDRNFTFQAEQAELTRRSQLEAVNRARMWDLEKLEIASRHDFAEKERERTQERSDFNSQMKQIEGYASKDILGPDEAKQMKQVLIAKFFDIASPYVSLLANSDRIRASDVDKYKGLFTEKVPGKQPITPGITPQPPGVPVKPTVKSNIAFGGKVPTAEGLKYGFTDYSTSETGRNVFLKPSDIVLAATGDGGTYQVDVVTAVANPEKYTITQIIPSQVQEQVKQQLAKKRVVDSAAIEEVLRSGPFASVGVKKDVDWGAVKDYLNRMVTGNK